jgi:signal peptidase II
MPSKRPAPRLDAPKPAPGEGNPWMRTLWITAAVVFVLDQVTKVIVVHWLNLKEFGSLDVLPPFLNFRMAWNRGINFGLFAGDEAWTRWLLIAIALVIAGWVVWWLNREEEGWLAYLSGGLLVGGALGNVIDRILYGAVADFPQHVLLRVREPLVLQRGRHLDLCGRLRAHTLHRARQGP